MRRGENGGVFAVRHCGGGVFLRVEIDDAGLPDDAHQEPRAEAVWWQAATPYLDPEDREELVKAARRQAREAAKRRAKNRSKPAIASVSEGILKLKTFMELEAIKAARRSLYDALVKLGLDAALENCSAAEIDAIIESVWDGLRASMHQQSARGEFPI